jgi:phytoene dehydrogenase-like protein
MSLDAMHAVSTGNFVKGGSINLSIPLADYIKEQGGEIMLGAEVSRIIVADNRVLGVQVGNLPLSASEMDEPEIISAPLVVHTLPVWGLLNLISEADLPHWFVRLLKSYQNPDLLHSVRYGGVELSLLLKEEALKDCFGPYEGREHRVAFDMPYSHGGFQGFTAGANDPSQRTDGFVRFSFMSIGFRPELFNDRATIVRLSDATEKDFEAMFPEITEKYIAERKLHIRMPNHLLCDGLARMPYYSGNFRIDHKGPVEGLYFGGDTVRTRGCCMDAAVRSAIWCFNRMTGENVASFIPT